MATKSTLCEFRRSAANGCDCSNRPLVFCAAKVQEEHILLKKSLLLWSKSFDSLVIVG
jgi:hypothetical protein